LNYAGVRELATISIILHKEVLKVQPYLNQQLLCWEI